MATEFEYGFYNSKADSIREYDAKQFGRMFDGILNDGVFKNIGDAFKVTYSGEGMKITLGTGRAWFNHTFNYVKQAMQFRLDNGDSQYKRYDVLVLKVNTNEAVRENSIYVKSGEPSTNPELPTLVWDEDIEVWEHPLAIIEVPSLATTITSDEITNLVGLETMPEGFEAYNDYVIGYGDVISDNHLGSVKIDVHTTSRENETDWIESGDPTGTGTYYTKTFSNLTQFGKGSIFNTDLFVSTPSASNPISNIQAQEESFSYIFKFDLNDNDNTMTLYSYYPTKVDITVRFTGKGVNNVE